MAERRDQALTNERTNYIRGRMTLEVSLEVLWDSVRHTDFDLVEWWKDETKPELKRLLEQNPDAKLKPWQKDSIARLDPEKWDISVLSYAIHHSPHLRSARYDDLKTCAKQLKEVRDVLSHLPKSQLFFDEYILRVLRVSIEKYKILIPDEELYMKYVKQLESIDKYRIRDQETKKWEEILLSRDAKMKEGITDEEIMEIHKECACEVKKCMEDVKQEGTVKQHMENQLVGNLTSRSYSKTPVTKLNNYHQKKHLQKPKYVITEVAKQEFICTVIFESASYEGPKKGSKRHAKHAAAQRVIDALNIVD